MKMIVRQIRLWISERCLAAAVAAAPDGVMAGAALFYHRLRLGHLQNARLAVQIRKAQTKTNDL
jgi:hypothetical protein